MSLQSTIGKPRDIKSYVEELLKFHCRKEIWEIFFIWEVPKFPLDGAILIKHNCPGGREMGTVINMLKEIWAQSKFNLNVDDLLKHLPQILKNVNQTDQGKIKKLKK